MNVSDFLEVPFQKTVVHTKIIQTKVIYVSIYNAFIWDTTSLILSSPNNLPIHETIISNSENNIRQEKTYNGKFC